ncbi:DNA-binding cell septation regulator SpoVG [Elusimicrobium posterum]
MPSRKLPDGTHKDMVHPINQEFREYLETNVIQAYKDEIAKNADCAIVTDNECDEDA